MTSGQRRPDRPAKRPPASGFFYDRFIPALLIVLAIVLAAVILLSVLALIGVIS